MFRVAKIVNTHGLKGELKLVVTTDFDDRFKTGYDFIVKQTNGEQVDVKLESVRSNKQFLLVKFKDYLDIDIVQPFKGGELYVTNDNLAELDDDEYYFHDLVNCKVLTTNGEELGVLADIIQTGANDVYVVNRKGKKDLLLPVIDECIKKIDIENKIIEVELMPGMEDW